jgi:hypothetical protein
MNCATSKILIYLSLHIDLYSNLKRSLPYMRVANINHTDAVVDT